MDELILPLCSHLAPRLSDELLLGILGTVAKRLEVSLQKVRVVVQSRSSMKQLTICLKSPLFCIYYVQCQFTVLGAFILDTDMRSLLNYVKERVEASELQSNVALCRACKPLSRLVQISSLMRVDDLDDVLDLISREKRKGGWDMSMEESRNYLSQRVEFESDRINHLLRDP